MKNSLGLNYWVLGGFDASRSAHEAIEIVGRWGLDSLELTVGDLLPLDLPSDECAKILRHASQQGVLLQTLATGYYWGTSLGATKKAERERAIEFTERYIALAGRLGVSKILITAGAVDVGWDDSRPVEPYEQVWENSTNSMRQLEPTAAEAGVTLCVENVWSKFLLSPIEMRSFVDQFQSEHVGVYFDVGNVRAWGYPEHWIDVLKDRIRAVHVKNYETSDSLGTLHGFTDDLLQGDVDFDAVKAALKRISYSGPITAEMIPFCRLPELRLPDRELAERTAGQLRELFR